MNDELKLKSLETTVDQAVLDRAKWVDVCDHLADFLGGVGTAIVPETAEHQAAGLVVTSSSLEGLVTTINRDGWISRNYRRRSIPLIKERGFATDYDIADDRTLRTDPFYADLMASQRLGVFLGLNLVTTSQTFIAAVERPAAAPVPDDDLLKRVDLARSVLSAGARASVALGSAQLESWKQLASEGTRAVFMLDALGRVIDRNAATEPLLGSVLDLSRQRLRLRDLREDEQLSRLIMAACEPGARAPLPRPVFTAMPGQGTLMLEALRLPETLRFFHSLAAALLVVRPVEDRRDDLGNLLRRQAGLTTAELKAALALFEGKSITEYAASVGLTAGTVRQQLKSVYRKTGTARQNELSALIRRLSESVSG